MYIYKNVYILHVYIYKVNFMTTRLHLTVPFSCIFSFDLNVHSLQKKKEKKRKEKRQAMSFLNTPCEIVPQVNSFFFFFPVLGFELRAYTSPWATPPALFCVGFFQDKVSQTICSGWL
jgi:hypothetical protein